ncbi:MAG: DNA gyrase subunit A [Clostridiaceae bacterium]|nr:DNA gyrase subunit A [Clostridiaceae bacterium]
MADPDKPKATQADASQDADALFRDNINNVIPVVLEEEMRKSFIDYAMSVITDRALPDARDGLKPVHRRILYSMQTQSLTPDKPFRKSATVVGEVLGHYHPHGDASVYDAMVRLAQDFSMRHPLVDGHGNFGSRDGDPPAAYRYTEARLTRLAVEMMSDINKNTVDFKPNFDEHDMEPVVLPTHFPNLLVNGSMGIAVGMATSIPAHNLRETIDGTIHLMRHPEASVSDLMEFIKGPDFPTGGTILGTSGIREAYETGRGKIVVRAEAEIEDFGHNRQRIVIRDLPFAVNKARLIERIADLVKDKRVEGISNLRDESARDEAVRIVIELRKDANANLVLNQLYKNSQLQDNFNANMLALVPAENGGFKPETLTLKSALQYFIAHEKDVRTRRVRFDLEKAEARRHIVEGLRIAIDNIDEVIRIIRSSATEDIAKQSLSGRFGFSDRQAQHIVDMRLGRLTGLERDRLEAEYKDLTEKINYFLSVLADESLLLDVIEEQLNNIKQRYGDDRRTKIDIYSEEGIADESLIKEEHVVITLTRFGYIKRTPISAYTQQHRGGRGVTGLQTREEDYVVNLFTNSTHDFMLFFTSRGKVFKLKGYEIPEAGRNARGTAIVNLLQLDAGETIETVINIPGDVEMEGALFFATRRGNVKLTELSEFANINKRGIIAIRLLENDNLVSVHYLLDPCDMMLATAKGLAIRFAPKDIRPMGRSTQGVRGIRLAKDDDLIGAIPVTGEEEKVLMITEGGYGKCTLTGEYRPQTRGGKGLITYKVSEKTGKLVGASCLAGGQEIMIVNDAGLIIRISGDEIPLLGRSTQGVRIMRTQDGHVRDFSVICEETEITELAEAVVQQNLSVPDEVDEVDVSLDEEDEISSSDRGDEL